MLFIFGIFDKGEVFIWKIVNFVIEEESDKINCEFIFKYFV